MQAGNHAAHRPRRHVDPLRPAGAARHTEPLQVQRGGGAADTGGLSVRTPGYTGRLDTGRLDTGRLDTGRADAGRPLDRLDGRPHRGPDEADRATTGLAGVRTCSRPATPAGRPDLAGSRRLGRSASHDGSAVTAPAPGP
jgi:hypothetical protein